MEDDADPLVMYLVVRRRTTRPFRELAVAAAVATRRCAGTYLADERWAAGFDDWWRDSFRKVCLRAEPREWEAVRMLDHERVGDVACLPPRRRSQRERVLAGMQVHSDVAGELPAPSPAVADEVVLVVNQALGMSAGKILAQIGHGALMAPLVDAAPVRVCGATGQEWDAARVSAAAVVSDGGLTEIPRGSETVAVLGSTPAG